MFTWLKASYYDSPFVYVLSVLCHVEDNQQTTKWLEPGTHINYLIPSDKVCIGEGEGVKEEEIELRGRSDQFTTGGICK